MLDRDVLVLEPAGLVLGGDEEALEALGDVDLVGLHPRAGHPRPLLQLALQLGGERLHRHVHAGEQPRNQPFGLFEQGGEQVLAVDLLMAEAERLGLRRLAAPPAISGSVD